MNKTALIIGVLALTGVGAFLYFRPKSSAPTTGSLGLGSLGLGAPDSTTGSLGLGSLGLGAPDSTTTAVPPTGTQLFTPEQVEQIAIKMSEARDLTKRICELKKQYKITVDEMNDFMNFTSYENPSYGAVIPTLTRAQILAQQAGARKKAVQEVADSINKLKELGYKEENCLTVRIA
jgi:hypothetical protein